MSLVQLCLEREFTRGHGALYDALAAGRVDDERLFSLLAPELPQAVDGPEAREWIAEHDVTGHGVKSAPLFVFDAGYSAAALADGLAGCPVHVLVRLAAGSVFYAEPVTWEGKNGRPPRCGTAVHCLEPADFAAAAAGSAPRGRKKPLPPNPEPDETLVLPDTPLYGTVRAQAWYHVHPLIHGDRGWFAGRKNLPVLPGTLIHVTVERLPDGRDPHRALWLWHAGPGPCPWTSSGAPTSPGSTSSMPSGS